MRVKGVWSLTQGALVWALAVFNVICTFWFALQEMNG